MQKQSHGPKDPQQVMSQNIWSTLRMAISMLGRPDLYPYCDNKDIDHLNKEFGMNSWCMSYGDEQEVVHERNVPKSGIRGDKQLPGVLKMIFEA